MKDLERIKKYFDYDDSHHGYGLNEEDIKFLIEQAEKFDELQRWWWWLQRRTHEGITPTTIIRRFLHGISMMFEPYKEDDDNGNTHDSSSKEV